MKTNHTQNTNIWSTRKNLRLAVFLLVAMLSVFGQAQDLDALMLPTKTSKINATKGRTIASLLADFDKLKSHLLGQPSNEETETDYTFD